jgi:putative CocE/NonD family hydrolase
MFKPLEDRTVARGYNHLPFSTLDEAVLGRPVPVYRTWIEHTGPDDAFWRAIDYRPQVKDVTIPIHLVAGWYDIFLDGQMADYATLVAAGRIPYLTVGPWTHMDPELPGETLRAGLDWFDAHLKGKPGRLRSKPVRLYVMGANEWREYESWPPPADETPYFLHHGGWLSPERPSADSPPDRYRYDPADPTPGIGGALLSIHAGPRDNRPLEARPDVLTFTTEPLIEPLEIIGPLRLRLYVRSNREYTDFTGRLCDVQRDGRSLNISDGFFRVRPGKGQRQSDGSLLIELELSPTAYRFRPGHRLRLQVASGAHPRIARNPGTGEYNLHSSEMVAADQELFHDEARPSALILPI